MVVLLRRRYLAIWLRLLHPAETAPVRQFIAGVNRSRALWRMWTTLTVRRRMSIA
jgi:hypothetical protein